MTIAATAPRQRSVAEFLFSARLANRQHTLESATTIKRLEKNIKCHLSQREVQACRTQ